MSLTLIAVLILGAAIVVALIALVLYKIGFRVDKIKAKLPVFDVEASRKTRHAAAETGPHSGPTVRQRAIEGGVIEQSGVTAPAGAAAEIDQQAAGEGSKIDDSPIKLT